MKKKDVISTLALVTAKNERRAGNSTRMVDAAIQSLFDGYSVEVRDHFKDGRCRESNEFLMGRIIKRLWNEHHIGGEGIILDWNQCTIRFH